MSTVTLIYGEQERHLDAADGSLLGEVIAQAGLPLEQPCAGRGTCGSCKVLVEAGGNLPDEIERQHLTAGELAVGTRLACRARVEGDTQVVLSPMLVYSNKIFRGSNRHRKERQVPLGLAIDLGSTTVAAYLTLLDRGEAVAGAAAINQQRIYGADIIARLSAARNSPEHRLRLQRLAVSSINQAINALQLSQSLRSRLQRVSVVGNVAMHHLLA
ncbi:MAG: 2Fe-2S iron-sulfur cluster binding domain-containing protein, partial [Anaerolineales bacterium]|nr:2Fe-2S iron-sulfur cluster binding domain-containing protein [Anaerolineales bacterium]